jgi:mannose-6-phosphate isomerase class I
MKQIYGLIKHYDWGVDANNSYVAKYAILGNHIDVIDYNLKYAELWLGTKELPYLFKFLSIYKPLSIQIHPDKELAKYLFETKPNIYPDSNHKPEIAIALKNFEALAGLKSIDEINKELLNYPEITVSTDSYNDLIKSFLNISNNILINIINRITIKKNKSLIDKLIIYINSHFKYDVGILSPIYMNYVKLDKYQALYIKPNVPHVYLKGNIFEIMAFSDNVIRLALTNKIIDRDSLNLVNINSQIEILNKFTSFDIDNFNITVIKISKFKKLSFKKNSMIIILSGFALINNKCYLKGSAILTDDEIINIYATNVDICIIKMVTMV